MTMRFVTILIAALLFPDNCFAQLQRPSITSMQRAGNFFLRTRPNKEQRRRLQPAAQDLQKYAAFLQKPKTGIFRLMPDLGCTENLNIIRADAVCLEYIPESSYYSFREKEHTIEMLADIRLRNGFLISDGILSQSILVHLGDVELDRVAPPTEGLDYLRNFAPQPQGFEAQKQYLQMLRGVKVGKFEYKKALPLIENGTYALRVIAFRGSIFRSFRGFRFDVLEGDRRVDMTIAFRVVRKEEDGAATLLWREIERRDAPRIIFQKRAKPA